MGPSVEHAGVFLEWVARLASVGIIVRSFEFVANWRALKDGETLGWGGIATSRWRVIRLLQCLQGYPFCLVELIVRGITAAAVVFLSYGTWPMTVALLFLVLAQVYHNHRFAMLASASEHLLLAFLCALLAGSVAGVSESFRIVCLGFIAFQVLLAYTAAARHKLVKPHWRDGTRLIQVFQESAYRFPPLGRFLDARPRIAMLATWLVIVLHLMFPLSLVLPTPVFASVLAGGLLFHGTLAFTMGLHGFFWTFAAAYPALYFFHMRLAQVLYHG